MEIVERRTAEGGKEDVAPVEIWGTVEGFIPAWNRVLIRRSEVVEQGMIVRPEVATELSERGVVIESGITSIPGPFVGALATFSKYGAEEKHFDDEGSDKYVLCWVHDIRGWHASR